MAGDCMFRPMVPFLEIGSVTGGKGELIKTMCEETRARIRVLDAPVATPDYIVSDEDLLFLFSLSVKKKKPSFVLLLGSLGGRRAEAPLLHAWSPACP